MSVVTLKGLRAWDSGRTVNLEAEYEGEARDIDCTGMTLAPGFQDPHVHWRDPGDPDAETMLTGARAAAAGGYTNTLVMPNTTPAMDGATIMEDGRGAVEYARDWERDHHTSLPVHYQLCAAATIGRAGTRLADILAWKGDRTRHPDHPVTAISDDGATIPGPLLYEAAALAKEAGLVVIDHAEHHEQGVMNEGQTSRSLNLPGIPGDTESRIVERDILAARDTGAHIHLQHVSCATSISLVRQAKRDGIPVTCETAPHYIALTDRDVARYGTRAKMNPPLRAPGDRDAIWEALADGTIDMVATDHAPHTLAAKTQGMLTAPNGVTGLESAYAVCHTTLVDRGIIGERRLIGLMAIAPGILLGRPATDIGALAGTSGTIRARAARGADLVILDTQEAWTIRADRFASKARNTPFDGWKVTGRALATVLAGRLTRIPEMAAR